MGQIRQSRVSLASLSLLLFLSIGCEEKIKPTVLPGALSESIPHQESWNSTVTLTDSGKIRAVIDAGYIRVYADMNYTLLSEGIRVRFFNDQGEHTSTLTANEGKVDDRSNDLEASGSVRVVSTDSTRLETSHLFWDNLKRLIHTQDHVRIISEKEKIQGRGLEADQHLQNYRIFHVTGEAKTD